jgi:hypothetical protein
MASSFPITPPSGWGAPIPFDKTACPLLAAALLWEAARAMTSMSILRRGSSARASASVQYRINEA